MPDARCPMLEDSTRPSCPQAADPSRPLRVLHYNVLFSASWEPDADARFRFDGNARELYFRHAMKKYRRDEWRAAFDDLPAVPAEQRRSAAEEEREMRAAARQKDIRGLGNKNQNAAFYFEGLPWEQEIPVYLMKKLRKTKEKPEGLSYYARDETRLWRRLDEALEEHDPGGELRLEELWERRWSDEVVAKDPRVVAMRRNMQKFIDLFSGDRRLERLEAKLGREIEEWESDGVPLVICLTEVGLEKDASASVNGFSLGRTRLVTRSPRDGPRGCLRSSRTAGSPATSRKGA